MKSDLVKKLLRALVTALGIGLGSVLAFVIVQLNAMAGNPSMSIGALLALYAAFALLLGLGGVGSYAAECLARSSSRLAASAGLSAVSLSPRCCHSW